MDNKFRMLRIPSKLRKSKADWGHWSRVHHFVEAQQRKIETFLKSRSSKIILPKVLPSDDKQSIPAEKRKGRKLANRKDWRH